MCCVADLCPWWLLLLISILAVCGDSQNAWPEQCALQVSSQKQQLCDSPEFQRLDIIQFLPHHMMHSISCVSQLCKAPAQASAALQAT